MNRLREMTVEDKVCEQVSMPLLTEVYPQEVIERCVQPSEPWNTIVRRVRLSTAAFGRSSKQYGPGAYPQVKCVLLAECGSHAVVGLEMDRDDVSEVHGSYRLLSQVGPDMLLLVDAGLISGACIEQVRERRAHVLGA